MLGMRFPWQETRVRKFNSLYESLSKEMGSEKAGVIAAGLVNLMEGHELFPDQKKLLKAMGAEGLREKREELDRILPEGWYFGGK